MCGIMTFNLSNNNSKAFRMQDPYNPQNMVEGVISMQQGSMLGNLIITKVNDEDVEDYIMATPKFHYPVDNNEAFLLKNDKINRIECVEKIDGSNIYMFKYKDHTGNEYISYKSRGMPFITDAFKFMWDKILDKYKDIPNLIDLNGGKFISFELYGAMNKHGIIYDIPIDTAVLFARDSNGNIYPSSMVNCGSVGKAKTLKTIDSMDGIDLEKEYHDMRMWLESLLKEVDGESTLGESDNDQGYAFEGMEGSMWYVQWYTGEWSVFKCKPPRIESICFKVAEGIRRPQIIHALFRVLENGEEPSIENISAELETDYPQTDVGKAYFRIKSIVSSYFSEKKLTDSLFPEYESISKEFGWNIVTDKNEIMRHMSKKMVEWDIDRKKFASRVYTLLNNRYGA